MKKELYPRYFWILIFIIGVLSIWIRMAFPIFAIGSARFDDALFIRQAAEIGLGHWLGNYDNLTHSKGIGYSLFLLFNHATGLPLKFSEHLIFLSIAAFFSFTIGQLCRSRYAALTSFIFLAFIPTAWSAGEGGRVVREGLYVSQALMLITLGIRCWALPSSLSNQAEEQLYKKWKNLIVLGLVAGWFWITREEGVWLLPAMLLLMISWVFHQENWRKHWRSILIFICMPFIVATFVVGSVNTINYIKYGVFRNNDFRSSDYQSGYGALTRIRHDNWQRYVLFPHDARERAYAMSAAARELKPYFEGAGGEFWRKAGCTQTQIDPCPEILSGWFMWALRDAVAEAGHYGNANDAQAFYRRLAQEIQEGCQHHPSDCFSENPSLLPPWRNEYALDTIKASWSVFLTLATFGNPSTSVLPSEGDPRYLELFDVVTNGPLSPVVNFSSTRNVHTLTSPRDAIRIKMAQWFTDWMRPVFTYGLPLVFIIWLLWSVSILSQILRLRRMPAAVWWVATSLAVAVITRVLLLGFLEATSIPSNNMLYLFPLVPIALTMLPVVLWGAMQEVLRAFLSVKNLASGVR